MENIEIHVEITNRCMLKCKHCSSLANSSAEEVDFNEIINFIKNIGDNYKIRLVLTGGEPLLRYDLEILLEKIRNLEKDIDVGLFTTGLTEYENEIKSIDINKIIKLKDLGLKFVFVSVYSNNNKIHDSITQSNLSFEKTMESIKRFINEGIETNINLPLMKVNQTNLSEIIYHLRVAKVNEIRLLKLINHGVAKDNWENIGLTIEEQINALNSIQGHLDIDEKISLGGFLEFKSCQYLTNEKKCLAGKSKLYIDNKGDVYPCGAVKLNSKTRICNIREIFDINTYDKQVYLCMAHE